MKDGASLLKRRVDLFSLIRGVNLDIFDFLYQNVIEYERVDHPPVYTVAEAREKVPPLAGAETKNLFLRTRKADRHLLVVVDYSKSVDLKALAAELGVKKLGFASPERLMTYLGIEPGSVSLLAVANDVEGAVEVIIDRVVWDAERVKCHPLVNTSTLSIAHDDLARFLALTKHKVKVIDVPERVTA